MENPLLGKLTWTAIQVYHSTYAKVPSLVFDIDIQLNPRAVRFVSNKPKSSTIIYLSLYFINGVVLLLGVPKTLLEMKRKENRTTMRILATSTGIFYFGCVMYVISSIRTLANSSHCIPFINAMINNKLRFRK